MTRKNSIALILAALTAFVMAVGCGGGGGGGGGGTTVVTGIVRDSANEDTEVEGATVTIGGVTGTTRTVNNADAANPVGSFRLEGVATGVSTAVVTAPGKAAQTLGFTPSVAPGANPELSLFINIGQVRGRVLGTDGKPVRDAFVVISTEEGSQFVGSASDGTFLIEGVAPGAAQITANFGTATALKNVTVGVGLLDLGDITLVNDPNPSPPGLPRTVKGTVTLLPGSTPAAGANVILLRNGVQIATTLAAADGSYGFSVPAGVYAVRALSVGFQDKESATTTLADPNAPITLNLALSPN